ncbi:MAG: phosphopantothenoylcysteine decarboxylase [Planctomycetota bacterium]
MTVESVRAEVAAHLGLFPERSKGRFRFLVTAGPTFEDLDEVRFLANRSTGRMGSVLAETAQRAGHAVLLLLGPTHLEPPPGISTVRVRSALDMQAAVQAAFDWCDALFMAAAVTDYRPGEVFPGKLHKDGTDLIVRFVRTPDILKGLSEERTDQVIVGFSLEPTIDIDRALKKREEKGMDIIVANTGHAFGSVSTDAVVLERGRDPIAAGGTKEALAEYLLGRSVALASSVQARRTPSMRFAARRHVLREEECS